MKASIKITSVKYVKNIFFLLLFVGFSGCVEDNKGNEITNEPIITTFYLIRHSEKDKSNPNNVDPELIQKGLDRAIRWAEVFDPIPLDAIYSTNYERTLMTAAPTSVKKNIDVQYYDPRAIDVEALKMDNAGKNVLIVGHSNTTPDLTNKILGNDKYDSLQEDDNASLFIIRIIDGVATDFRLKID